MRDPGQIYTRQGTPIIVFVSRLAFAGLFVFALYTLQSPRFPYSNIHLVWIIYLLFIYFTAERLYDSFLKRGIDLTFAWPLLFAVYCLNLVSLLLAGQERLPLLNRAEHLASFILITFIVWVFFLKYLPQRVWRRHTYYTALIVFSVTSTLGVANELVELMFDSLFNSKLVGPRLDTSLDLLMNSLGAGLFLAVRLILGTSEAET